VEGREDKAWLLRNRFNPLFGVEGTISLADGTISFTLSAEAAGAALGWIEERTGEHDLGERLGAGESVEVFSHPIADCDVTWPITAGGLMMCVQAPDGSWVISHDNLPAPAGAVLGTFHLSSGRSRARAWKKALVAAEREAAPSGGDDETET
jgi:hypothetical protein